MGPLRSLLVVEDDEKLAAILTRLLEGRGWLINTTHVQR